VSGIQIKRRGCKQASLDRIKRLLDNDFECWLRISPRPGPFAYLSNGQIRVWVYGPDAYEALCGVPKEIFDQRGPWVGYVALYQGQSGEVA